MAPHFKLTVLAFLLFIYLTTAQQCTTKINLDNLLQDQILISPTTPDAPITEVQQYFYPRTFFTATPKIIASIQSYEIPTFSQINYQLKTAVSRSFVTFTFTSDLMKWVSLKIKFWLTSRVDLLIGSFALSTTSTDLYSLNVQNAGRNSDNTIFSVKVTSYNKTTITFIQISYAIFNFQLSYFASGGGQLNYLPISGSEYSKIHGSFAPIIYEIQGFNEINLPKTGGLNLEYIFDSDFVLQTKTKSKIEKLSVAYLSIGAQPKAVCSCDQFIMKGGCVDTCPASTYPFVDYAKGGKSCLTCSAKLNETINEFSTGCVCLDNMERHGEYCVPKTILVSSCSRANTVLVNGECICVEGSQLVNGSCQSVCKANEEYVNGKCQCVFGMFNISGVCGTCSNGKVYDGNLSQCVCPQFQYEGDGGCVCVPNYFMYDGKCIRTCPSGTVKVGNTCVAGSGGLNTLCSGNQILIDGKCSCINSTYIVNGTCTTCPLLTYYNITSQTCIMCLANCDICFNFNSCSTCKSGYYYNQTTSTCQMSRTCLDNQVLNNGMCDCAAGLVDINGVCGKCLAGEYYKPSTRTCEKCVVSCLSCTDSTSCLNCLPNYTFNTILRRCVPICGANQTLLNDSCQCIANTYRINGVCSKCLSNQFYDTTTKSCAPCMLNCLTCSSTSLCNKCIDTYYINPATKLCEPSNCPVHETIVNGKCDCAQGYLRISGVCSVCKEGEQYDPTIQICKQCADNCTKCKNLLQCEKCQPYFDQVNGECRFNLYDKKQGYPQFMENLIITDFASSQPTIPKLYSQDELNRLVKIDFSPNDNQPGQTLIQQNPKNSSQIRVILSYCGSVPFNAFNATYTFNDKNISIKEDIDLVKLNLMEKGFANHLA